jgi:predicted esterase
MRALLIFLLIALPGVVSAQAPQPAPSPSPSPPAEGAKLPSEGVEQKIRRAVFEARAEILNLLLKDEVEVGDWAERGDQLKSDEDYLGAAIHYAIALKIDPKLHDVAYQLACTFSLWDYQDLALEWIEKAVERGFWGHPVMVEDPDLDAIRAQARFKVALTTVKARYPAAAKANAGEALLAVPSGPAPAKGWPVVIFLHGWGDSAEGYAELAKEVTAQGVAGLALPGAVPQMKGSYRWPTDSFATTHAYLQQRLSAQRKAGGLDASQVYLVGFSQGALHAIGVLAGYPNHYRGALAISPGGRLEAPASIQGATSRRLVVLTGKEEPAGNRDLAQACVKLWKSKSLPVQGIDHAGGHEFPPDFAEQFPKLLKWLRE